MSNVLNEYFEALQRLKKRKPLRVPKGAKINNDTVAIEAGRKAGSIKKSRTEFDDLRREIAQAAQEQTSTASTAKDKLDKVTHEASQYRDELETALARELSLVRELYALKKQLAKLTGGNVLPIRGLSTEQ